MTVFEHAVEKIEKAKNEAITESWDAISGHDAFLWLSGYIGALKDNELINADEFAILREKLRQIPIHSVSPGTLQKELNEEKNSRVRALELACRYGGTDEMHHLQWVVDQMVRELAGEHYAQIVAEATAGEDGSDTYKWHTGTAP